MKNLSWTGIVVNSHELLYWSCLQHCQHQQRHPQWSHRHHLRPAELWTFQINSFPRQVFHSLFTFVQHGMMSLLTRFGKIGVAWSHRKEVITEINGLEVDLSMKLDERGK